MQHEYNNVQNVERPAFTQEDESEVESEEQSSGGEEEEEEEEQEVGGGISLIIYGSKITKRNPYAQKCR